MYFYLWRDLTKKLCTESTWVNDLCVMPNDLVLSVEVLWIFRSPPLAWRLGIIGYLLEGPTKNQLHFMGSGFISITSYCINSILNYIKLYILYIYIYTYYQFVGNSGYCYTQLIFRSQKLLQPCVKSTCAAQTAHRLKRKMLSAKPGSECCQQILQSFVEDKTYRNRLSLIVTATCFFDSNAWNLSSFLDCCWWYQFFSCQDNLFRWILGVSSAFFG